MRTHRSFRKPLASVRFDVALFALVALGASTLACGGGGGATSGAASPSATTASATPTPASATKLPDSDRVTWKKDASAKSCHVPAKGVDLVAGVNAIVASCVDTTKMHQVGTPTSGQGQASTATMVQSIPLKAQANHCYRVFGLAEPTVTDFDVAVMDSAGKSAGEDSTDSSDAVVLEDGAICFKQDDAASINTAVASGQGKWTVEVWSD